MGLPGRVGYPVALLQLFIAVVLLFVGASEGATVDYEGWKILSVDLEKTSGDAYPPTLTKLEEIEAEGYLVVLSSSKSKGTAEVAVSSKALEDLTKMQEDGLITFKIVSDNFGRVLALEDTSKVKVLPRASVTFSSFMDFSQISSYLEGLPSQYPDRVRVDEVGRSVENRTLYRVRVTNNITNNVTKKVFFIDGGIHAREWVSPSAALYVIETLLANTGLTESIEWQIMPLLNPDGYVYTWTQNRMWRKNRALSTSSTCVGVDLNRNFGYQWGGLGTSSDPCSDTYKGASAFSEPESRALRDAMLPLTGKVKAYITFHSYGQYIIYPWGYSTRVTHPLTKTMNNQAIIHNGSLAAVHILGGMAQAALKNTAGKAMAQKIKTKTAAVYSVGNAARLLYPAAGASDDWVSYTLKTTYVYTVELRDTGSSGFTLPASQILPTVQDAWEAVQYLATLI